MNFKYILALAVVLSVILTRPTLSQTPGKADLVVKNANIYSMDAVRSWKQALAVKNGRLVYVGDNSNVRAWIGSKTKVVDARGKLILPGFHDTHVHLALAASRQQWCDLGYPKTLTAMREAISDCVKKSVGKPWILLTNPNTAVFPPDGPELKFWDDLVSDRPLVVNALHTSFANSAALKIAGITAATSNPSNGIIVRDPSGNLTGTLRGTAQDLLYKFVPSLSKEEVAENFRKIMDELPGYGIVSVQELSARSRAELYAEALAKGWLKVRVRHGQMLPGGTDSPSIKSGKEEFLRNARRFRGRWLNAGTVKIFVDGDLGDKTAALFEPYLGEKQTRSRGEPNWTQEELNEWAAQLDAAGIQLHFHAMGDRSVHMALNAVEHAQRVNGRRDSRHQITHLHLIASADLPRFRRLGVIANVQPYFAENIEYNTVRALELLGPERHRLMFRFRDLLESGAVLVASTDGPVASPLNPFVSIQSALTRKEAGSTAPAFFPEQRLTLPEVLAAYTIGGAYANFLDKESGSLEAGKLADFILVDQNLFEIDKEEIHRTHVLWSVVEGREVFRSEKWK